MDITEQIQDLIKDHRPYDHLESDVTPYPDRDQYFSHPQGEAKVAFPDECESYFVIGNTIVGDFTPGDGSYETAVSQSEILHRAVLAFNFVAGVRTKDLENMVESDEVFLKYDRGMYNQVAALAASLKSLQEENKRLAEDVTRLVGELGEAVGMIRENRKNSPITPEWVKPKPIKGAKKLNIKDILPNE